MDTLSLRMEYDDISRNQKGDPLFNPVRKIASDLFMKLEAGKLAVADLAKIVSEIEHHSFEDRMHRFHDRRSGVSSEHSKDDNASLPQSFEEYRQLVEETALGVVFTAHPTFALGREKRRHAARFPVNGKAEDLAKWRKDLAVIASGQADEITLQFEHTEAIASIENAQNAIRTLNKTLLHEAEKRFPKQWRQLAPKPVSLATWVGYDLDGRSDIHWGETIRIRLSEKAAQLMRYARSLEKVLEFGEDRELQSLLKKIIAAASLTEKQAANFTGDLGNSEFVVRAANFLTRDSEDRLVSLSGCLSLLTKAMEEEGNVEKARALSLLRSDMLAYGLGVARIHLRVNAAQVRSALKTDLGLDPDHDFAGRSALQIASRKAQAANVRSINFGSVFLEQMTARRQFMLCAQILKHIDADTPIRFLIAECEAPATVMGAIYLARLYGVDHKLDISPLFETPHALERGGRFLERLLDEPEYRDYICKRQRMSIQIGFSDSGRFMGQCAAGLAAERLQVLFARALAKANIPDVEALIFNTHGESMGRGAHTGTFRERINHLITPWVKSRFHKAGVHLNSEFSFQGGEGYLHFHTPELSDETIQLLWRVSSERPSPDYSDRFYSDINFSWDFYRGLKAWQEQLYQREDYRRALFSFPQNLLFKTGSRQVKRQRRGNGVQEISSVRAIPHNAMLQQLAAPINVSGGVGIASGREKDRFLDHVKNSVRMRELMKLAFHARSLASVSVLRAYAGVYARSYWSALAGAARNTERAEAYETVLQVLQPLELGGSFDRLADFMARDLRITDSIREDLMRNESALNEDKVNVDLYLLHAIRQALIARSAALVASAPAFSRRHDLQHSDLIEMALHLKLNDVIAALQEIFPKESPAESLISGLEEPVEGVDMNAGAYPEVHAEVIEPIEEINKTMRKISVAISNFYEAFG